MDDLSSTLYSRLLEIRRSGRFDSAGNNAANNSRTAADHPWRISYYLQYTITRATQRLFLSASISPGFRLDRIRATGYHLEKRRKMTQEPRSIRRLILGILSLALGIISLVAFFSVTYIAGIGFLGGFYGLILIALGVGLILPKKEPKKEEMS